MLLQLLANIKSVFKLIFSLLDILKNRKFHTTIFFQDSGLQPDLFHPSFYYGTATPKKGKKVIRENKKREIGMEREGGAERGRKEGRKEGRKNKANGISQTKPTKRMQVTLLGDARRKKETAEEVGAENE